MNKLDFVNLLMIDDKQENLNLISSFFDDASYLVKTTTSVDEALAICQEIEFDLILLDIRMPVDGFKVFQKIKSSIKNLNTPVIFMAEKTDFDNIAKAFKTGCRDIITKPFQIEELISKISTHSLLHIQSRQIMELMSAKDKVLSIISHDLRSPYNSLIGFSNLLLENLNEANYTEAIKYTEVINKLSVKNLDLLDSLINYAKNLEKDALNAFDKINVNSLISEVLQVIQPTAMLKDIKLNLVIGESAEIHGKKDLIATMIRNILSNAIKFTPTGGQVTIQSHKNSNWVELIISDNGVGMDENKIESILTNSKIASTSGTSGELGTGYGLLLTKEIVEKHHGKITIDSKPGLGTSFRISLPRFK